MTAEVLVSGIFKSGPCQGRRQVPPGGGPHQNGSQPYNSSNVDSELTLVVWPDKKISHQDFEQAVFVGESLSTKIETIKVCHTLLQSPQFFQFLVQIDAELAAQMHATPCACGGVLHRANYPRKPRACPQEVRHAFESRWSFCCSRCRKRSTAKSVRFLGRRVYVALAVVVLPQRRTTLSASAVQLCDTLEVPARTIARWRQWWLQRFANTTLWSQVCARFMPPVQTQDLPTSLIGRFMGATHVAMVRLLGFLSPLSVSA